MDIFNILEKLENQGINEISIGDLHLLITLDSEQDIEELINELSI